MEYRALGPLEVLDGSGHELPLGGVRQQTVLASLLLRAGQTVGLERLVDELWEEPPATAARTIQAYVSRLRHFLPAGAIESRPGGYALLLNGARLDLHTFEQTAEEGRAALASGEQERAAQLLGQALALWRGPALAGLTSDALRREAVRLEELRFEVLEDRLEADLASNHLRKIVPELEALVAEHPFRERPRSQLMLALYRAGRQTEALAAYQDARRTLVDELGVEPSARLRELEQAILRQDVSLEADALPSGTVTLLFTDIEGSTLLLRELGGRFGEILREHRRVVRSALAAHGGREVDTQGDSFFTVFPRAADAVEAALEAQRALSGESVRIRIALHTGEPERTHEGYVGLDVVRGARLCAAGHGGQILLSETTRALVDVKARDLGQHVLKDLPYPERIYQLGDDTFPPPRGRNLSNLAVQATELVGRDRELDEARRLLRQERTRLVTLVGPPGVGKTRLAVQLASNLTEDFKDGVFLVGLAPITDPALVGNQIAQTVGARGVLVDYFRSRRTLLVVDNFEHLLGAAPLLAELLAAAPGLRLLATSREPLHLTGERQFPIRPLPLDDAVRLFVARARDVGCELDEDAVVAGICRRLDLLPLAIELAAARTKVLSPEALLARLERRLELLTGGARDLPERQRTLRSTIEWSYELLTEDERRLFARLAVFSGGCTLEAAEEVCEGTLDEFASLVDKSLVVLDNDRLSLHETIREYALERLEQRAEAQRISEQHAEYFLKLFETDFQAFKEGRRESAQGFPLRAGEQDNARAALTHFRDAGERKKEARLAGALERYWYASPREGRRVLEEILAYEGLPAAVRARALLAAASTVAHVDHDHSREKSLLEEALTLFDELGERHLLTDVLARLGAVATFQGNYQLAWELLENSKRLALELGNTRRLASITNTMAHIPLYEGDYARGRSLLEEALSQFRSLGHARGVAVVLGVLGSTAVEEARLADAASHFKESLATSTEFDIDNILESLDGLAAVAAGRGEAELAARLLGVTEDWRSKVGLSQEPFEAALRERTVRDTVESLGAETYSACLVEGRGLSITDAVDFASRSFE